MSAKFEVGQEVVCVADRSYMLTIGKVYKILEVYPPVPSGSGFTFPEYVVVADDFGKKITCHSYRFRH